MAAEGSAVGSRGRGAAGQPRLQIFIDLPLCGLRLLRLRRAISRGRELLLKLGDIVRPTRFGLSQAIEIREIAACRLCFQDRRRRVRRAILLRGNLLAQVGFRALPGALLASQPIQLGQFTRREHGLGAGLLLELLRLPLHILPPARSCPAFAPRGPA